MIFCTAKPCDCTTNQRRDTSIINTTVAAQSISPWRCMFDAATASRSAWADGSAAAAAATDPPTRFDDHDRDHDNDNG